MRRKDILAERELLVKESDLSKRTIVIQLGKPYWVSKDQEAACPVAILGLYDNLADTHGVDPYQALELAMQLVNTLLEGSLSGRQKLYWPNGERYDLSRAHLLVSTRQARRKSSASQK